MFQISFLNESLVFPALDRAHPAGLLAAGGDLSVSRLILAYASGIFPWFDENDPYLWWSPDPRFVLFTEDFRLSKRQERAIRQAKFHITANTAFDKVIELCARIPRNPSRNQNNSTSVDNNSGTWITSEMIEAYKELFEEGYAHSVEVWQKTSEMNIETFKGKWEQDVKYQLVGGLYGVRMGEVFCGESMFHFVPEASRAALQYLIDAMKSYDIPLLDSQQKTEHIARMGGIEIPRAKYIEILEEGLKKQGTGLGDNFLKT